MTARFDQMQRAKTLAASPEICRAMLARALEELDLVTLASVVAFGDDLELTAEPLLRRKLMEERFGPIRNRPTAGGRP